MPVLEPDLTSYMFFHGLTLAETEMVKGSGVRKSLPRKTILINQGDAARTLFLIISGQVNVFRCSKDGEEVVTRLMGAGETVLENAVFYGKASPVSAQTETDAELLSFSYETVVRLVQSVPAFALNMAQILATRANEMMYLLEQITLHPAVDRVAGFLLQIMLENGTDGLTFQIPYEKSLIARHLGVTQATLSRCFKTLEGQGVQVRGRQVTLANRSALCQFGDPIYAHKCKNCGTPICHLSRK
jgi:CRP-like cAMP-binding protein